MRLTLLLLAFAVPLASLHAQPLDDGPKSPEDSLRCIKARPGFVVELMAAEPVVQSPIAFAWGPDGKFWVVEMGDYPLGIEGKKGGGTIKVLTKSRPDGPYDKATVFLDGLAFPTGVTPWKKGVLVTCAPDIFYAEDTDGDGKADKKEVLFTGFKEGNQQHRVNGLVYGLDGWFYGANGDSGGVIVSVKTKKEVDIRGRDFRLDPETGEFEGATGQTQFGRCRDDFGNWFGNNNSNPMYHYVLEDHYLSRNPYLIPPSPRINVSVTPGASRVYPISKPQPRFNTPAGLNHFTSACSTIVYRDDFFGPEFYGNAFVSEPVHNLIHREIMERKGITFSSRRADDEKESEFLASTDNWFRPTTIATGPDGALWIADMYRQVIEHPEWIPKDWQKKIDLRAGHDKGRIYRVYPKGKTPRPVPNLAKMKATELAEALTSPNGWIRDNAQRLLKDSTDRPDATKRLLEILQKHPDPRARIHVLAGLSFSAPSAIAMALTDSHHEVRKWAVRFEFARRPENLAVSPDELLIDPDVAVRMQTALSWPDIRERSAKPLGAAAARYADDPYFLAAALSSANNPQFPEFLAAFLDASDSVPPVLAAVALKIDPKSAVPIVNHRLAKKTIADDEAMAFLVSTFSLLDPRPKDLAEWIRESFGNDNPDLAPRLQAFADLARRQLENPKTSTPVRLTAIAFLGHFGKSRDDGRRIASFLDPSHPDDIQSAALAALAQSGEPANTIFVLNKWKQLSPRARLAVLDFVLATPTSTRILLDRLDGKEIAVAEIDSVRRVRLVDHPEEAIRNRSRKLFASATNADRAKVVDDYWVHQFREGDAAAGAKVFAKSCAVCHKFGGQGQEVGPDLAAVKDRSPEALLVAIFDPNRAVEARYLSYVAETKSGKILAGILTQETGASITLVAADGKKHDILRADLESLASTGKSLMPEGMEKELPPREFADLLAYLRGAAKK